MIIELKDKLDLESMIDNHGDSSTYAAGNAEAAASVRDEVIMALTALGYSNTEAVRAVRADFRSRRDGQRDFIEAGAEEDYGILGDGQWQNELLQLSLQRKI